MKKTINVKGDTPREYDQFFTKRHVADECVKRLEECLKIKVREFDMVLEPSAGEGAFLNALKQTALVEDERLKFIDIDAQEEAHRMDFLSVTTDLVPDEYVYDYAVYVGKKRNITATSHKKCITVGNPPFGKNSSLAIAFFNQAARFSAVIAFILPKTFCKNSVQNKLDRHFILLNQYPIDTEGFIFQGKSYTVPCVFQVWINIQNIELADYAVGNSNTIIPPTGLRALHPRLYETDDFLFTGPSDLPDLAIRRVGVNAGRIFENSPERCSKQSHFFLKAKNREMIKVIIDRLKSLNLEKTDVKFETAGCPSISKSEICDLYMNHQ